MWLIHHTLCEHVGTKCSRTKSLCKKLPVSWLFNTFLMLLCNSLTTHPRHCHAIHFPHVHLFLTNSSIIILEPKTLWDDDNHLTMEHQRQMNAQAIIIGVSITTIFFLNLSFHISFVEVLIVWANTVHINACGPQFLNPYQEISSLLTSQFPL